MLWGSRRRLLTPEENGDQCRRRECATSRRAGGVVELSNAPAGPRKSRLGTPRLPAWLCFSVSATRAADAAVARLSASASEAPWVAPSAGTSLGDSTLQFRPIRRHGWKLRECLSARLRLSPNPVPTRGPAAGSNPRMLRALPRFSPGPRTEARETQAVALVAVRGLSGGLGARAIDSALLFRAGRGRAGIS
jgi:hypothetical protein